MLDSSLNVNAVPNRGNGTGKSWDRSSARARGSALSRDYRSTASALGLLDPTKVVGNYSLSGGGDSFSPANGKRTGNTTTLTSVTKSDYRAPSYGGYRNGYNGGFQSSVLNSYARNDQTAWNREYSSENAQQNSSFRRVSPVALDSSTKDLEHYSDKMTPKDLDFATPIEPRQFNWPTPKSVPDDLDPTDTTDRAAPLSKEEFFRNLKAEQAKKTSMTPQNYGLNASRQFMSPNVVDSTNYQGPSVSGRPFNSDFTNFKQNYQENTNERPNISNGYSQPSFQQYGNIPESELQNYAKEEDYHEKQESPIAEKPYESYQPVDSFSPGYTKAAVKSAAANAQSPVANYSVGPGYTDNKYSAGIVKPRYGAPSRDWPGLPSSDPSYSKPEYKIPPPEAGLKKLSWKDEKDQTEITRLAPVTQARYPGDAYKLPEHFTPPQSAYVPSNFEQQRYPEQAKADYPSKVDYENQLGRPPSGKQEPDVEYRASVPEESGTKNEEINTESSALKGLKKIQTTNQTYGSWVDDPYLRGREWWYKPTRFPLNKTFLSKFKEDAGLRS